MLVRCLLLIALLLNPALAFADGPHFRVHLPSSLMHLDAGNGDDEAPPTTPANPLIETISATSTEVLISGLFDPAIWASEEDKRVIVPEDVIVGSESVLHPAMETGIGMGGTLTVEVHGSIQGAGGAGGTPTSNPGPGGPAFKADVPVVLEIYGSIYSGGGGGGAGGTGGRGTEAELGAASVHNYPAQKSWCNSLYGRLNIVWNSYDTEFSEGRIDSYNNYIRNGHLYGCSNYSSTSSRYTRVTRQPIVGPMVDGSLGGNGGRGRGFLRSDVAGQEAAEPTVRYAGKGGTGGSGGDWGQSGRTGSAGASGNTSGGATAPTTVGAKGKTIVNPSKVTQVLKGGVVR